MKKGFSVIEVMLAAALFIIFATGIATAVIGGFNNNRSAGEQVIANQYAVEGLELARNVGFSGVTNSNNTFDKYTRSVGINSIDTDTKKVTSTVSWNFNSARANSVVLTTYLTNWMKLIIGDWVNPNTSVGFLDLTGKQEGLKVQVQGNYAYLIRDLNGGVNFIVINISNPVAPTLTGSLTTSGIPTNIYVSGNYAYISAKDANKLKIIDISNPASPTLAGVLNLKGGAAGNSVFVSGSTAYLIRAEGGTDQFDIINVSNPATPTVIGSLELSKAGNELVVMGNYAYVATSDTDKELQIIDISNPASPTLAAILNFPVKSTALTIAGFGTTVVLGEGSNLYVVDVSTPTAPALLGTYATGGTVNDISLGNTNKYAFLATNNGSSELEIIDISTPATPTLVGIYNDTGNYNGLAYDATSDRVYAATAITTGEFIVISP